MGEVVGEGTGVASNELLGHYLNDHLAGAVAGVEGKRALWRALQAVAGSEGGALGAGSQQSGILDLDGLVNRAQDQIDRLESHRLTAAIDAFSPDAATG